MYKKCKNLIKIKLKNLEEWGEGEEEHHLMNCIAAASPEISLIRSSLRPLKDS